MRLAFIVPHIGPTHLSLQLLSNLNNYLEKEPLGFDPIVGYENMTKPCIFPKFMTTNIAELWGYSGILISTTLGTTHKILKFPSASAKFFYVWDLEWINIQNKNYEPLAEIYQNDAVELIARSASHANILQKCWGRPVKHIVNDFNMKDFLSIK